MRKYFVFDVESVGLHGPAYAVGYVVVNENGEELDNGLFAVKPSTLTPIAPELRDHVFSGYEWICDNCPTLYPTHDNHKAMRVAFWDAWTRNHADLAKMDNGDEWFMAADVPWPVEANFLSDCIKDNPLRAFTSAPYPLVDIASVLLANGMDPLAHYERDPNEFPVHDPRADARQSARLLVEALHATFVIVSNTLVDDETGKPLYWCNEDGWVDKETATKFTKREQMRFYEHGKALQPTGGTWMRL